MDYHDADEALKQLEDNGLVGHRPEVGSRLDIRKSNVQSPICCQLQAIPELLSVCNALSSGKDRQMGENICELADEQKHRLYCNTVSETLGSIIRTNRQADTLSDKQAEADTMINWQPKAHSDRQADTGTDRFPPHFCCD